MSRLVVQVDQAGVGDHDLIHGLVVGLYNPPVLLGALVSGDVGTVENPADRLSGFVEVRFGLLDQPAFGPAALLDKTAELLEGHGGGLVYSVLIKLAGVRRFMNDPQM